MSDKYITVSKAASILKVSPRAVRGLLDRGTLLGEKEADGRTWKVDEQSVYDYKLIKDRREGRQ